jgi:hypothetical protein
MTVAVRTWSDLGVDRHSWVVSGVFQVDGADYEARFTGEAELARFVDFLLTTPGVPATSRLYLHPDIVPARPERQLSTLRFQFDAEHDVAAAVLLVLDPESGGVSCWMTSGRAGRDDIALTHDSWDRDGARFPPEAFVTITELRAAVLQWAFGEVFPPAVIEWTEVPHQQIGWR